MISYQQNLDLEMEVIKSSLHVFTSLDILLAKTKIFGPSPTFEFPWCYLRYSGFGGSSLVSPCNCL